GGVILGVLREIAMRARFGDLLNDTRPFDLLAVLELLLQHGVTGGGHRDLFHRSRLPPTSQKNSDRVPETGDATANPSKPLRRQIAGSWSEPGPGCLLAHDLVRNCLPGTGPGQAFRDHAPGGTPAIRPCRRSSSVTREPGDRPQGGP